MHQWSTSTHKTLANPAKDCDGIFQYKLPRWALQHDFILDGLFSLAALEISLSESAMEDRNRDTDAQAGLKYYNKAVSSFREWLPQLPTGDAHLAYLFSTLISIINIAISQCMPKCSQNENEAAKEHFGQFMVLISASSNIFAANEETIRSGPVSTPVNAAISSVLESVSGSLSEDYESAFSRLEAIVDGFSPHSDNAGVISEISQSNRQMYHKVIKILRLCFVEESKTDNLGFCLVFPSMAGPMFVMAYNDSDALALYIALYWALLLHGLNTEYWWAKGIGRRLGQELSDILLRVDVHNGVKDIWQQGIAWVRMLMALHLGLSSIWLCFRNSSQTQTLVNRRFSNCNRRNHLSAFGHTHTYLVNALQHAFTQHLQQPLPPLLGFVLV
jgi:hypothetical protein